jgi:putative transposase
MRRARIKIAPESGAAVYHCISRVVNGERLLDETAREVLRKQLWQIADYCGVEILTYAILSNHFHVLVRVPLKQEISDSELLRRYRQLYPKPDRFRAERIEAIAALLRSRAPEGDAWRRRQLALMNDVSQFMKLLKQRFTLWFNHTHERFGTLWAERFKSVLIEQDKWVLRTVAAYIDLNPVRAGLVEDPKDYRFCGYAEAVAGREKARFGISMITTGSSWRAVQAGYRELLYGSCSSKSTERAQPPAEAIETVLKNGGSLPLSTVLRCRWRYFSDGSILGSRRFLLEHSRQMKLAPPTAAQFPWSDELPELAILHRLRGNAWG